MALVRRRELSLVKINYSVKIDPVFFLFFLRFVCRVFWLGKAEYCWQFSASFLASARWFLSQQGQFWVKVERCLPNPCVVGWGRPGSIPLVCILLSRRSKGAVMGILWWSDSPSGITERLVLCPWISRGLRRTNIDICWTSPAGGARFNCYYWL